MLLPTLLATSQLALTCNFPANHLSIQLSETQSGYELAQQFTRHNYMTGQDETESKVFPVQVLGELTQQNQKKIFIVGTGAFAGKVNLTIDRAGSGVTHAIDFSTNGMGGGGDCQEEAGYAALELATSNAGTVTAETAADYRDSQLGLKCVSSQGEKLNVRTIGGGFASLTTMVGIGSYPNQLTTMMDAFQETADAVVISIPPGHGQYPPVPADSSLTIPKQANPDGSYTVSFLRGGVSDALSCKPYWALENVWKAIADQRTKATALPDPVGTLADVKTEVTTDYEQMKSIQDRYSDLIMAVPGVNGMGVMHLEANDPENPLHLECEMLEIMLLDAADLAPVKAILGESFNGGLIHYVVSGPIIW